MSVTDAPIRPEYLLASSGRLGLISDKRARPYLEAPLAFAKFPDFSDLYRRLEPRQRCAVDEMLAQRLAAGNITAVEELLSMSVYYVASGLVARRDYPRQGWWVKTEVGNRLVTCGPRPKLPKLTLGQPPAGSSQHFSGRAQRRQAWRCSEPTHSGNCADVSAVKIHCGEVRVAELH